MKRMLALALTVGLCATGAVTAAIALAADPPAARPEVHQVFAPGIAGDTNVLAFPTQFEGSGECIEFLWDYRVVTGGPFGGGFQELQHQIHEGVLNAWWTGSYIDEPLLNVDVALPNIDAENVVVIVEFVEFEDSSALGMRMWLGPDGHWRQSIRVDNDEFRRHKRVRISICPQPRTAAPATNAKVQTLDPNTVKVEPATGAALAGTKLLIQPSPGDAILELPRWCSGPTMAA